MKHQLTCLLVDDDRDDQEVFTCAIHEIAPEIKCFIASDGLEAIEILSHGDIHPDYIFLDLDMPRMNGYEFLRTIKDIRDLKDIRVVVHSTSARPKDMDDLIRLGVFGIHLKEHSYQNICKMLSKYLVN